MPREAPTAAMRDAYRLDTAPLVRQRFAAAVAVFVVFMGVGAFVEATYYPVRAASSYLLWELEAAVGILGAAIAFIPAARRWSRHIVAATAVGVIALVCTYHGSVAASAERLATILGSMLNLFGVVVPWGWPAQAVVTAGTLASFAGAAPHLVATESMTFPSVVLAAAATTSVCATVFLDRYGFEAFRRTALQTEEAQIAAALAHVTETLSRTLCDGRLVHEVNRLAVAVLGVDFSTLFLLEPERGFRMASTVGGRPDVVADLAQLEFPPDSLPLLGTLRPGLLTEIENAASQNLVPPALLQRLGTSSVLIAPVARGDRITGVLAVGYNHRTGPFSSRQCRLAVGIAHAAAVALENTRLVDDLQAANRLKSEFVATMSHELRTPLNVIMGYTQMLADGAIPRDDAAAYADTLRRIERSARELLDLVGATLDLGRLESGRETIALHPVDVALLLDEVVREAEPIVPPGVTLGRTCAPGLDPIDTDRAKLKTVLKNLVGNALKFTDRGRVDLVARVDDGRVAITVRDTGIGIAPEHLAVIFDMFRQVDSSNTRRHGGVGLGLHIGRRLVHLLGGSLEVESRPGEGSAFTVSVPRRSDADGDPRPYAA